MSEYNSRDHWTVRHKRISNQKGVVKSYLLSHKVPQEKNQLVVRLTRISPRKLDDDNLRGALKATRDAVADWLHPGLAPGRADELFKWEYGQEQGTQAVRIEIDG